MKRREFIALLGSGVAGWPLAVRAQQPAVPLVGFLHTASAGGWAPFVAAFRNGLKEAGLVEAQDVVIEFRWAEYQDDRLPALAAELVRRRVAVIVSNTAGALAAKAVTTTVPIVFTTGNDPVKLGLVASLNRPGGNLTGAGWFSSELEGKRLGLLNDVVPQASVIAVLMNPNFPDTADILRNVQDAARTLGKQIRILSIAIESEIDAAFATIAREGAGALVVSSGPFFTAHRDQIVALAARHAIPAIYPVREVAAAGGLMSYSSSVADSYRRAGLYAARVIKGEKPAEMPVDRSTRFELVINLKTAKTLGLTIPPGVLAIADEVIE